MAQLRLDFPDDLFRQLERLEDVERVAPMMVDAALPVLHRAVVASYGRFGLASRVKIVPAKKVKNGGVLGEVTLFGKTGHYYLKGKGKYPLSNAGLAVFLEYGAAAHGNFPATPAGGYL